MEGYWCSSGSSSATQYECGGSSVYCPSGSSNPLPVPNGYYSIGGLNDRTRTSIQICDVGAICSNGIKTICPSGTFSNAGKNCTSCPSGRYSSIQIQSNPLCEDQCMAGSDNPFDTVDIQ